MLDIEEVGQPADNGTAIISVADLKKRLRISHSRLDDVLEDCIVEAAADLHGLNSEIRRSVFPTTWCRYLRRFPDEKDSRGKVIAAGRGIIPMPFPPLVRVLEIAIEDGASPTTTVDPATYVVSKGKIVGEIELRPGQSWPAVEAGPRAISILFQAGYADGYPPALKRFVAIKAAHNFWNNSASINEPRQIMINRRVEFGVADLRKALGVPLSYDDWGEN